MHTPLRAAALIETMAMDIRVELTASQFGSGGSGTPLHTPPPHPTFTSTALALAASTSAPSRQAIRSAAAKSCALPAFVTRARASKRSPLA